MQIVQWGEQDGHYVGCLVWVDQCCGIHLQLLPPLDHTGNMRCREGGSLTPHEEMGDPRRYPGNDSVQNMNHTTH